jgi:hypothetical protein
MEQRQKLREKSGLKFGAGTNQYLGRGCRYSVEVGSAVDAAVFGTGRVVDGVQNQNMVINDVLLDSKHFILIINIGQRRVEEAGCESNASRTTSGLGDGSARTALGPSDPLWMMKINCGKSFGTRYRSNVG